MNNDNDILFFFNRSFIVDKEIKTELKLLKFNMIQFKMTVGSNEAIVMCKNKREGKQRAAQKILQNLHPDLKTWGSLLKLYGQSSYKASKMKVTVLCLDFFFCSSSKFYPRICLFL